MSTPRREFLKSAWQLAVGAGASSALPTGLVRAEEPAVKPPLIVDTHQHLWDLKRLSLPWLDGAPAVLKQNYRPEEYASAVDGLNIRTVYMEVDVAEADHAAEADYVVQLCKGRTGPMLAAVIGGRPASSQFAEYVKRYASTGAVRGVRQVLHNDDVPRGVCLATEFVAGCRTLGEHQLSFDLCMRPTELSDGATLAGLCPNTRFIVDHCGNADPKAFRKIKGSEKPWHEADPWKRDMDRLAALPNVLCKISGIVARAPNGWTADDLAPIVNHCLDTFGPQRVVFGGDWPVCLLGARLKQWIDALTTIIADRPEADRRALWSENAVRYYRLTV